MPDLDISKLMSVIVRIRNAADSIAVSGHENRELINFIYNNCNSLLKQVDAIMSKQIAEKEVKSDDSDKNA